MTYKTSDLVEIPKNITTLKSLRELFCENMARHTMYVCKFRIETEKGTKKDYF